jgi:hypothetical protein
MAEPKTKPTQLSVEAYLGRIADPVKQADCRALVVLMRKLTKQPPVLWGPSIVGFGRYHYTYDSGHSGESCATGFAARKTDISIYLLGDTPGRAALLRRLGKHKMGKACLSIKRLADVDTAVLAQLIAASYAEIQRRYPATNRK